MGKLRFFFGQKNRDIVSFSAALLVAAFAFILSLRKVENFDIWWHIKVGEGIIQDLRIPLQESFSHTMAGTSWTPHEWLAEVMFYLVHLLGGVNGLSLFTSLVVALTAWVCWLRGRNLGSGIWSLAVLIVWALLAARFRFMARPHIFFFLLANLLLFCLEYLKGKRIESKNVAFLLAIPLILLFWVNIHGSFPLAYGFLAVWALSESVSRKISWPVGGLVVALLIILANPGGLDTLVNMKDLFIKASLTNEILNEEFLPPSIKGYPYFWSFLAATVLLTVSTVSKRRFGGLEFFTIVVTAVLAVKSVRFIAIFVLASVPYVAVRLNILLESSSISRLFLFRAMTRYSIAGGVVCVLIMILGFSEAYGPEKTYEWGAGLDKKTVPVNAVAFLDQSGLEEIRLYNNFEYGGYLTYTLFPRFKVARDGRAEIFAPLNNAFMVRSVQEYQHMMTRFAFQVAVVPIEPSNGFEKNMREDPLWKLVYWDDQALVYARGDAVPQEFLDRWQYRYFSPFSLDYSYLQVPVQEGNGDAVLEELNRAASTNPQAFKPWVYLGYVNALLSRNVKAIDAYEQAINVNSTLGVGHYGLAGSLGDLYLKLGQRERALDYFRQHLAVHQPRDQDIHRYALILYELKDYKNAEKYFADYLKIAPEDPMGLANYGFLLVDLGKNGQAREMFKKSFEQREDGPGEYGLALTYQKEGDCAKAIPLWQDFIRRHDNTSQVVEQARQFMAECGN
nr:tetratricopeptide repeat protein [Desulfobulbaceae bacterium]